jgi:hypothetical protein
VDKEAETRDRVKHTAARVGLRVPDTLYAYEERDAEREEKK